MSLGKPCTDVTTHCCIIYQNKHGREMCIVSSERSCKMVKRIVYV